jgi:hypothetical protein
MAGDAEASARAAELGRLGVNRMGMHGPETLIPCARTIKSTLLVKPGLLVQGRSQA